MTTMALGRRWREARRRRSAASAELVYRASHDPLTGLYNCAELDIAIARWNGGHAPSGLLCLDIDGFKSVNDGHGHHAGDEVLRITASRVIAQMRPSDEAFRLGGDEFLITIGDPTTRETLIAIGERMLSTIAHPMEIDGARFHVTASIGATLATTMDFEVMLREADAALYTAKRQGRARVVVAPNFASLPSVSTPSSTGDAHGVPPTGADPQATLTDRTQGATPR